MIVVFTNGCFDLIHPGHVDLLERARAMGDRLIVGLNSDRSTRAIRGAGRPFVPQEDRAAVLRALRCVDEVLTFDELTPARLIEDLQPDILVKGGDWPTEQIIGADTVLRKGGRVFSLPMRLNYSTTGLVEKILRVTGDQSAAASQVCSRDDGATAAWSSLREHVEVIERLARDCLPSMQEGAGLIIAALTSGRKLLLCGNGGSAADAQHIAAEFVGRFDRDRQSYPAIALTTDTSILTSIGNDFGFEQLFARQMEGLASQGDVLVAISTSGNSPNVLAAVVSARRLGCRTIGLTGSNGKRLASLCDVAVMVPSARTSRIQEAHITIGHLWCELVDTFLREDREP